MRILITNLSAAASLCAWMHTGSAAVIPLANHSFELPATDGSDLHVGSWAKTPKPEWFVDTPLQTWDQFVGVYRPVDATPLRNIDGNQAVYLFALPEAGLFQDISVENTPVVFTPGASYQLTFAVAGGHPDMPPGVTLLAALYYRNSNDRQVHAAVATVTNSAASFPEANELKDFVIQMPSVQSTDPWAGRTIGILFLSTAEMGSSGGTWSLDNVRLSSTVAPGPLTLTATRQGNNLRISWSSSGGFQYQIQATTDLVDWQNRGQPVSGTGERLSQFMTLAEAEHLFYRLVETPAE